jgi:hypothetical protein
MMTEGTQHCRKPDPAVLAFYALTLISCSGTSKELCTGFTKAKFHFALENPTT